MKLFFPYLKKLGVLILIFSGVANALQEKLTKSKTEEQAFNLLIVDKSTLKARIKPLAEYAKDNTNVSDVSSSPEDRVYSIIIGKEKGDKINRGDNRTPEGIYFTQPHLQASQINSAKHGPIAVPLDFPNPMDQSEHRTGSGIWVHGAGNDGRMVKKYDTEGCVAFYNSDILVVAKELQPNASAVVIADDLDKVQKPEDVKAVFESTSKWLSNWRERDINGYIQAYSKDFVSEGKDLHAFQNYKGRVFKSYKKMTVEMNKIRVISQDKYAVSFMNQDFEGDGHFKSVGKKILYWKKSVDGSWKIYRESFNSGYFR